jgi:hypothetical protein
MSHTIRIRGVSEELKARLESAAERNFRSLNQEALARLQASFDVEDALLTKAHQKCLDEAMAGTFHPGSIHRLKQIAIKAKSA